MVGMWRLGKLKGRAWVLKSVRVFTVWAALYDRDVYPALGEMGGKRASAGARANDTYIEDLLRHLPLLPDQGASIPPIR